MKRVLFGLVAAVALMFVPTVVEAGHHHHGGYGWNTGYRGGWGGGGCYRAPRVVYRPPVTVYRPVYPAYGYPYGGNTSFYYNGPNASFGFGF